AEAGCTAADAPVEPQKYSSGTFWGTTDEGRGSVPAPGRALPAGRALPSFRQGAPGTSCRPGSRTHAAAEFLVDPSPPRPRPNRGLRPFSAFTRPVRRAHGTWTGGARIVAAPPLTRDRDDATAYRPHLARRRPARLCRPGSRTRAAAEFLVDPSPPRPRPNRGLRPFSAFTRPVRRAHGTWTGGARIVAAPPLTRDRDDATAYRPHLARRRPARLCRPCRRPGEPRRPLHPAYRRDERQGRDRAVRGDHVHGRALPLLR